VNPRGLLSDVVRSNAPLIARGDRRALACVLASADDYADSRPGAWLPDDIRAGAESERRRALRVNRDSPDATALRRQVLYQASRLKVVKDACDDGLPVLSERKQPHA
jgi:hypothetical protein